MSYASAGHLWSLVYNCNPSKNYQENQNKDPNKLGWPGVIHVLMKTTIILKK